MSRFSERLDDLRRRLRETGVDGAILSTGVNLAYFTGFAGEEDRHLLLSVSPDAEPRFVSPAPYVGQVRNAVRIGDVRSVPDDTAESVVNGLASHLSDRAGRYLIDDRMRAGELHAVREAMSEATFELLREVVEPMRRRKDESELARLRTAAERTDEVSRAIRALGPDAVGMTERELATEIRARLHERGAEGVAFPPVVAAGANGARPTEYRHGERTIEPGEPVVLDFGGFFERYASDQTRTVVFDGEPPDGFAEAHQVVEEALEAGVAAAEPGVTCEGVDAAAREVVEEAGYGEAFTTGTGHGIGLRGHEPPAIAPGSTDVLQVGSVFTVEPGIYLRGEFGVRLETVVALTEDGTETLNTSPRTWRPL